MNGKLAMLYLMVFSLLAVPVVGAVSVGTNTYTLANTDQGVFTDAVVVGNDVYFLMNSAIYKFNLTSYNLTKVFDTGFSYVLSSIIYTGNVFKVAGYKLYTPPPTSGGSSEPVVTCPLKVQNYNIENITVWTLDTQFDMLSSTTLPDLQLENISYYWVASTVKLFDIGNEIYAVILDTNIYQNDSAYIYTVGSNFTKEATIPGRIIDVSYDNEYWYFLTDTNEVLRYNSAYQYVDKYKDSTDNLAIESIYVRENRIYLAGRGSSGNNIWGAAVEVLDTNFSMMYYREFTNEYQFYSVSASGKYVLAAGTGTLYAIDWANNTISYEYKNDLTHVYDMKTEKSVDISGYGPHAITIATWNENGTLGVAFGGFYEKNGFIYAYMVLTDKPTSIPADYGDGGAGFTPLLNSNFWDKYKYEMIAGGVLLFLIILSGGKRGDER